MCKTELPLVYYSHSSGQDFASLSQKVILKDAKLGLLFETQDVHDEVMILLRFNCPQADCDMTSLRGWHELRQHVGK